MQSQTIVIADADARRLSCLLDAGAEPAWRDAAHLRELRAELERAVIVAADAVPPGVITMGRVATVLDVTAGTRREFTLVYPHEADAASGRISVLAPLGTALLGSREGADVEWRMPGGLRSLRIEKVRDADEHPVRH